MGMSRGRSLAVWFLCSVLLLNAEIGEATTTCKAWLVQSIPTDMPDLRLVPGVLSSGDVLNWLAGNATKSLDLTVQYWELLAQPNVNNSGDYGFSPAEMDHFGAPVGASVYKSLEGAADRGIPLRIVQHSGVYPDFDMEAAQLAAGRPNVQNRTLLLGDWTGSGIIHSKVWIADQKHFYIGSANNDWKSLTQVKELGIYITDCPKVAKQLEHYFDNLWVLTSLNSSLLTTSFYDPTWQVNRTVPCWSRFLPAAQQCSSPLQPPIKTSHVLGYPYLTDPHFFDLILETPGISSKESNPAKAYLSFSPPELLFSNYQSDEQGWVETILSVPVNGTVRMNTMDWLGQSQFGAPTFWTALSTAIGKVVLAKGATVKVIAAQWAHSVPGQNQYLEYLEYITTLCNSFPYNYCRGKVEVKLYEVPYYNSTGAAIMNGKPTGNKYPGYTRVNHAKFAVSDVRAHIGTSNLIWDYFYTTNGVSFGTYDSKIVSQLIDVFEADWESPYAVSLTSFSTASAA
ncbi:unnamed protein product [Calypogeia fissa]